MSLRQIIPGNNVPVPEFIQLIENSLADNGGMKIPNIKTVLDEIFVVAAERGLNDEEFSLLLKFFSKGQVNATIRSKLLPLMVPCTRSSTPAMKSFMVWFISSYNTKRINTNLTLHILQWIISLLDYDLIDPHAVDIFYYDYYNMLDKQDLMKYACKLICKLSRPEDVTSSCVHLVTSRIMRNSTDKFLYALLDVFKGYKPHLVGDRVKSVNVDGVLNRIPHVTSPLLTLMNRRRSRLEMGLGVFEGPVDFFPPLKEKVHKISSLVPFPTFSRKQLLDKIVVCYPDSIKEAYRKFNEVVMPENLMSLLRDETGFFLITYKGIEVQKRLSVILLGTLESVFLEMEPSTEEDREFLLSRIYQLQVFMQQGLPCVSTFLSGYLLTWDGADYRPHILSLIEWASFQSWKALFGDLLRPLYMLFVSSDDTMKQQILQTVTNLIRNMIITDVDRVSRGLPHPFLKKAPAWTSEPLSTLGPLVEWAEQLIKIGLSLEPDNSKFLMQCIKFYETMLVLDKQCIVPMWTVVSRGVVYHSLLNITPIALGRICRLLLRYHTEFLPKLRVQQPEFYNECRDKINVTSKYAQEFINFLWTGQALSRKEDGIILKTLPEETLARLSTQVNMDTTFDLAHHVIFMPYLMQVQEKSGTDFLRTKNDFLEMLNFFEKDIAAFIKHFSPLSP